MVDECLKSKKLPYNDPPSQYKCVLNILHSRKMLHESRLLSKSMSHYYSLVMDKCYLNSYDENME